MQNVNFAEDHLYALCNCKLFDRINGHSMMNYINIFNKLTIIK